MAENAVVKKELTGREKKFCMEYLVDLNAHQAAVRAGYSPESAKVLGSRMLGKAHVSREIQKLFTRRMRKTDLKSRYVIDNLRWIVEETKAKGDTKAYMSAVRALELLGKHIGMFEDRLRIIHQERSNSELVTEMLSSPEMLDLVLAELKHLGYRIEIIDGHVTRLN